MKFRFPNLLAFIPQYRIYKIWVINTHQECNLYLWANWQLLPPAVNKLVALSTQPAFIRTYQSYQFEHKWLGFGRMKWSEENNIKWTTKYHNDGAPADQPEFFETQIWAPDWNKVCDTSMPPDVFISLYNFPDIPSIREGLTIALPEAIYKKK